MAEPETGRGRVRAASVTLSLASLALTLVVFEAGLRLAGFEFVLAPKVQFGWPDPSALQLYDPDPEVFWIPKGYRATLEAARRSHPAIVFMGDSCTEFGRYPAITLKRLAEERPDLATGVSVGVGGWSSEQGLTQLKRDVIPLHPAIITLYFGWNDHWVALGPPDAEVSRTAPALELAAHFRLAQLAYKAWMGATRGSGERPNRVDLPRYRSNLRSMIEAGRRAGARVVVITAASNHVMGREPEYLKERHLRHLGDLVPLHETYVQATRSVARSAGATVCDAALEFRSLPPPADPYFKKDGIHLTLAGDRALASLLAGCIASAAHTEK
jgi:lysophospholipase L1-like esterase